MLQVFGSVPMPPDALLSRSSEFGNAQTHIFEMKSFIL